MNSWFVGHIVMYVEFKTETTASVPVWENIVLVQASDHEQALEVCSQIGRGGEGDAGGTFTWDGAPACWRFAGVRKTVAVAGDGLESGVELTYSQFRLGTMADVAALARGESVHLDYEE